MELVGYRIAAWDTPLWVLPNRREGRYNDAASGSTQYLALHPLGPWAEMLRNEDLREPDQIAALRPPLWAIRVALHDQPLEFTFENALEHGLQPRDLVASDRSACRRWVRRLRADPAGPRVLLVPSAALPGTRNLVVLEPRVAIPYDWRPVDAGDLPTSLLAESGGCPRGLADVVHYSGTRRRHAALAAWEAGHEYAFAEPPTTHLGAGPDTDPGYGR